MLSPDCLVEPALFNNENILFLRRRLLQWPAASRYNRWLGLGYGLWEFWWIIYYLAMNSRCNISQHWKPNTLTPSPIQIHVVHLHGLVKFYIECSVYTWATMRQHCSQEEGFDRENCYSQVLINFGINAIRPYEWHHWRGTWKHRIVIHDQYEHFVNLTWCIFRFSFYPETRKVHTSDRK